MRSRPLSAGVVVLAVVLGCRVVTAVPPVAAPPQAPAAQGPQTAPAAGAVSLPNKQDSLKFGVLGDFGTGSREQYQLADQMAKLHGRFPYELVVTVGDNLYGSERPQDFISKFEKPYKPLLDAKVKFYASLGNHDAREQARYKLFNMDGKTYYTFKAPKEDVRFFALESDYPKPEQIAWLEKELDGSSEKWKIPYFHHPLYSSGEAHGSEADLRTVLEPLFVQHGVDVVFAGHEHFYERLKPQKGITYITQGGSAKLRAGNIRKASPMTAFGFDTDNSFTLVEIAGDEMFFETISRAGKVVDSGVIARRD